MRFKKNDRVVVFGDLHFPYHDPDAYKWALKTCAKLKPTHVIQIGDLYDMFWFSKYPKKFIEQTPKEEISLGYKKASDFWEAIAKSCPSAKRYQILGNHDDRPSKRIREKFPELEAIVTLDYLFQFPGVKTLLDSREELVLKVNKQEIIFQHGHLSQLGAHMNFNQGKTVVGHSHRGGVVYRGLQKDILWELNVGFLGDREAGPMQYGPVKRKNWTLGLGVIDELGPRFIPYG